MERYIKQIELKEVGDLGQKKLSAAKVLVIGAGGLGSPVLYYLSAAGIGNIGIADFDMVSETNLNRQILFDNTDINKPKAKTAEDKIKKLNPLIKTEIFNIKIDETNITEIIKNYDIVTDCCDNFQTRFIINKACCKNNKILVSAAINGFSGMVLSVMPKISACLECFYKSINKEDLNNSAYLGVLGAHAGIIGSLAAVEIIKHILGLPNILASKALIINTIEAEYRIREFKKDNNCSVCSK